MINELAMPKPGNLQGQLFAVLLTCSFLGGCVAVVPLIEPDEGAKNPPVPYSVSVVCPTCGKGGSKAYSDSPWTAKKRVLAQCPVTSNCAQTKHKVAMLRTQLKHSDCAVRTRAASGLGDFGPQAVGAISELVKVVKADQCKWARRSSVKALAKISSEPRVIEALSHATRDKDRWVAHSATEALKKIDHPQKRKFFRV